MEEPQEPKGQRETGLESQAEVLELLKILSDEERLIVTMSVFGGYKGEEISRMLHRKHSTFRSRYRRSLKKLEQELLGEQSTGTGGKKRKRKEVRR